MNECFQMEDAYAGIYGHRLLAAQLRKIQADMEGFAIQTDDQTAKQMYYSQSKELQNLIDIINPYLKE